MRLLVPTTSAFLQLNINRKATVIYGVISYAVGYTLALQRTEVQVSVHFRMEEDICWLPLYESTVFAVPINNHFRNSTPEPIRIGRISFTSPSRADRRQEQFREIGDIFHPVKALAHFRGPFLPALTKYLNCTCECG